MEAIASGGPQFSYQQQAYLKQRKVISNRYPPHSGQDSMNRSTKGRKDMIIQTILRARNHYEVLGVAVFCSDCRKIKENYKKLRVEVHPDKCGHSLASCAFQKVQEAYSCLSKSAQKLHYDFYLRKKMGGATRSTYCSFSSSSPSSPPSTTSFSSTFTSFTSTSSSSSPRGMKPESPKRADFSPQNSIDIDLFMKQYSQTGSFASFVPCQENTDTNAHQKEQQQQPQQPQPQSPSQKRKGPRERSLSSPNSSWTSLHQAPTFPPSSPSLASTPPSVSVFSSFCPSTQEPSRAHTSPSCDDLKAHLKQCFSSLSTTASPDPFNILSPSSPVDMTQQTENDWNGIDGRAAKSHGAGNMTREAPFSSCTLSQGLSCHVPPPFPSSTSSSSKTEREEGIKEEVHQSFEFSPRSLGKAGGEGAGMDGLVESVQIEKSWRRVEMIGGGVGVEVNSVSVEMQCKISSSPWGGLVTGRMANETCQLSDGSSCFLDIDEIQGKREASGGGSEYFVKWKGLSPCFNSWVGASSLSSSAIRSYEASLG